MGLEYAKGIKGAHKGSLVRAHTKGPCNDPERNRSC